MHLEKLRRLTLPIIVTMAVITSGGCSKNPSQEKNQPWWNVLTKDTVLGVKLSNIPSHMLEKMPPELGEFARKYLDEGATIRVRVKGGAISDIVDYWEAGVLVSEDLPLDSVEDSKLLSAYRSASGPTSWEIRVLIPNAPEAVSELEKRVRSHNQKLIEQIGQQLDSRGLKLPETTPQTKSVTVVLEDGKSFLQIGKLPVSEPLERREIIQSNYRQTVTHGQDEGKLVVFVSTPSIEQPNSPRVPEWTPGHRAANVAIEEVMSEWKKLTENHKMTALSEVRVSSDKITSKTLVDVSSVPWLNLASVKEGLQWSAWPAAVVQGALLSPVGKNSPFSSEMGDLFAKQLALVTLPSTLESSVLMTEDEADANVKQTLASAASKIKTVFAEISRSTIRQANFALWASPTSGENIAGWVECENLSGVAGSISKASALVSEWTGLDLSSGLTPVELSGPNSSGWVFGSPLSPSQTSLYVGIATNTSTAAVATSKEALVQVLNPQSSSKKTSLKEIFRVKMDANLAMSRMQTLADSSDTAELEKVRQVLAWIGQATLSAKIADAQTLEISLETSAQE